MIEDPVLITGGAGFIGSHLADALAARGVGLRILDSLDPQVHGRGTTRPRFLVPGAEFLHGSVTDRTLVDRALRGVHTVVHLAAAVGVGQSMYAIAPYVNTNTQGTAVLLDAMVNGGHAVRTLVVASSMSIYGEGRYRCADCGLIAPRLRPLEQLQAKRWEMTCPTCGQVAAPAPTDEAKPLLPTSVYAVTKRDQEELCLCVGRAYGIRTVALRLFNVYGPRQSLSNPYTGAAAIFASRLLNGQPPVLFEDGEQTRDFIHVQDIIRAFTLALECEAVGDVGLNIGTGRATSVRALARALGEALGRPREPEIVDKFREGDIRHCAADPGAARRLLAFEAAVTLEDGLRDLAAWVRREQAEDRVSQARAELERKGLVR
jgi:dTDP-L-rhamnose 4-epimerase